MADITLENGTDGLFDLLGQVFALQTQVDSSVQDRRTEWDSVVAAVTAEFSTSAWLASLSSAEKAIANEESTVSSAVSALKTVAEKILILKVDEAVSLPSKTVIDALNELSYQMDDRTESLIAPTVSVGVTPDGGNAGDCFLVSSKKTIKGIDNPQLLPESIDVVAVSGGYLQVNCDASSEGLSPNGFGGAGIQTSLSFFTVFTGLTGSGSLNSFTTSASVLPGSWIANVGVLGTAVLSGQPQTDTITITGTATSGTYRITVTTSSLGTQSTGNLNYDATPSTVAAALAQLSGFSKVSVSATGTSPNYVHTIKFYGMREAVTTAVIESTDSGGFVVATPTAFASPSLGSSPLVLVSDGSMLVSVSHLLTHLKVNTPYAVNAWLAVNTAAASGVVEISLTNGVGGSVIQDDAGNDLKYTVAATSLGTAFKAAADNAASGSPVFMMPFQLPASVYLRIRCSTTLPNTRKVFVENPVCAEISPLYAGGVYLVAFTGPVGFTTGDSWSVAVANDFGGTMHWGMERNFGLRRLGIIIPTDPTGTIADFTPL